MISGGVLGGCEDWPMEIMGLCIATIENGLYQGHLFITNRVEYRIKGGLWNILDSI